MRRRLALLALLPLCLAAPAAAQEAEPSVVVVGAPGLSWDDVSAEETPALARLADEAAVGVLSVKAAGPLTCAADGWLTLGAGNRVEAEPPAGEGCPAALPPAEPTVQRAAERAEGAREGAEVGALAAALEAAGSCVTTVGPGAALASRGSSADCRVRLVDAGTDPDAVVTRELAGLADDATLLVVGLAEGAGDGEPGLQLAVATGPGFPRGALRSASTRRAPFVQLVDVAPTVLDLLEVPRPEAMTGQPWRSVGQAPTVAELQDLQTRAVVSKRTTVRFYVALLAALLVLLAVSAWRRSPRLAELAGLGGPAALGASYLANLVPWWRPGLPLLALLAVVLALAGAVVAAALRVPGRLGPVGAVCGFVAVVVLGDLLSGARLQVDAVAGYSPLVAGRFAGIGNVAFGVLAASVLLATAALPTSRSRRTTVLVVALVGVVTVVVDGAPPWGSDVGGVLALVPAFALLGLLRGGLRVTWARLALAGAAGAAVVTAFALADHARAADDRTHLGRFVQDVVDGTAGTLLRRKAEAVLGLLFSSPVTALLPLVVAAAVYLVVRPPDRLARAFAQEPGWRHGLVAVGVAGLVGFAVNDSGAAVVALALLVAVPATVAVVARAERCRAPGSRHTA